MLKITFLVIMFAVLLRQKTHATPAECTTDAECIITEYDCSECGRCPGFPGYSISLNALEKAKKHCATNPPARLDPRRDKNGLPRPTPACSPCPRPPERIPELRARCEKGRCVAGEAPDPASNHRRPENK